MKLKKITYRDFNWELQSLELGDANLLVGKNATGKSRTLQVIDHLLKLLNGQNNLNWAAQWSLEFLNHKEETVKYDFETKLVKGIISEKIQLGDEVFLSRSNGSASLVSQMNGKKEVMHPPADRLVLQARRDTKHYSFLEDIAEWAEHSYSFKFGNISPKQWARVQDFGQLVTGEDVTAFFRDLSNKSQKDVIEGMQNIGFTISEIVPEQRADSTVLLVKEQALERAIPHYNLSQGMFRALSLIIFLEYLISRKKPMMALIDDLCEGLDYERARKLGKLVFEKCRGSNIQLVATSNDNFLMDVVDIECLNVLRRNGKAVTSINYSNHPELFDEFALTGFSNFDFFSSNYLAKHNL
ncbi:MAG: ATP-binding protein [Saprospiraceae bacterium]